MESPNGRNSGAGSSEKSKRWRDFTVPYTIDPNLPDQSRITNAIADWEAKTPLRFVKRTNQDDYIAFVKGLGCSSCVGRTGEGIQESKLTRYPAEFFHLQDSLGTVADCKEKISIKRR